MALGPAGIMDRERVQAIYVDAGCRIGADKWGQHQMRHRDRRSTELCKVLHIEKKNRINRFEKWFNPKGLFLSFGLLLGG
jgi:hypothetical protein